MTLKTRAVLAALGSFFSWGILPIYWKSLKAVPSSQIICHRIIWSVPFLLLILFVGKRLHSIKVIFRTPKLLLSLIGTALLLAANWGTFIWAVNSGFVLETSLGYFICPLLSTLFGLVFLRERLRPLQYLAIAISAAGVLYITLGYGQFPWIAMGVAATFSLYALARKVIAVDSLAGLTVETIVLTPLAMSYLVLRQHQGVGAFFSLGLTIDLLLFGAGIATSIPLFLYVYAARNLPLTLVGILQNIVPTGFFVLGVCLYHEAFTPAHLIAFSCIWTAITLYCVEGFFTDQKKRRNNREAAKKTLA